MRYAVWQLRIAEERTHVARTWETERLVLRLPGPEASANVREYGLRSAEFHRPFDPIRPADFWELPLVAERLATQLQEFEEGVSLCLFLARKQQPDYILGAINLRNIIRGAMQGCTVGYGLAPDALGQGYMTEALKAIVEIGFNELKLHRVEVNVMPRNAPSLAVAERAGFQREGVSPRYLQIAGVWEDHVRLARINDQWGR